MNLRSMLCLLLLALCTFMAQAGDWVAERAWFEDSTGQMTLDKAKQASTMPLAGKLFTQGYSNSAFWIRLRIDPTHHGLGPTEKLVVRLRPPYQDQIWLFDPLAPQDKVRATGDYYDWVDDEYRSLNLNFVIPVGEQPRDIWLRLKATVSTLTFIEIMTEDEVKAADRRQEMVAMLYMSMLFICLGWAVLTRIYHKDTLLLRYIIREVIIIGYALVTLGYLRALTSGWLSPYWVDTITNLLGFGFPAVVVWFDSALIGEFKPNRWLARLHFGLVFFFPIEVVLVLSGHTLVAARLSSLVVVAIIVLAVLCALSTRAWAQARQDPSQERPPYPKVLLVFVYMLVLVVVLLHRLPLMGRTAGQECFVYFSLVFPLLTSVLLMGLVQVRLYRLAKRQTQAQRRAEIAERDAQKERARRLEQSNFLKLLAHEMKTPLSVVRMALGSNLDTPRVRDMAGRAVQDMNSVIERLLDVERLEDAHLTPQRQRIDLVDMLQSIRHGLPSAERLQLETPVTQVLQSDARFVQVILTNLLENALKYGAADQPVLVCVQPVAMGIRIRVSNHMGRVGKPDPQQVFNKYYRAPRAHEFTGSGLGLYLSNALVHILGGRLHYSEVNGTICFELVLPEA